LCVEHLNGLAFHLRIDVHIFHGGGNVGVVEQLLKNFYSTPQPDKISGECFAPDVVVHLRFDAQLQPNSREHPIFVLVGVVSKASPAFLRIAEVAQGLAREREHGRLQAITPAFLHFEGEAITIQFGVADILEVAQAQARLAAEEKLAENTALGVPGAQST
jgi:hypothetical protein